MVSQNDFKKVLNDHPRLTCMGLESRHPENVEYFDSNREDMYGEGTFHEFKICVDWLSLCPESESVNEAIGDSYVLKHVVERWSGCYVSNGALIAAVFHSGIKYRTYQNSPNISIALSAENEMFHINYLGTEERWRDHKSLSKSSLRIHSNVTASKENIGDWVREIERDIEKGNHLKRPTI